MKGLFKGIKTLKGYLNTNDKLLVIHTTKIWEASFTWHHPVAQEIVAETEKAIRKKLPMDLVLFLTTISDGALLYYDEDFCQWGYKIYSVQEIRDRQQECEDYYEEDWFSNFIAIGEIVGNSHAIVANIGIPSKNGSGCELIEGDRIDRVQDWPKMSLSFHEWTDFLVLAQGAKFWDWCAIMSNFYKNG